MILIFLAKNTNSQSIQSYHNTVKWYKRFQNELKHSFFSIKLLNLQTKPPDSSALLNQKQSTHTLPKNCFTNQFNRKRMKAFETSNIDLQAILYIADTWETIGKLCTEKKQLTWNMVIEILL